MLPPLPTLPTFQETSNFPHALLCGIYTTKNTLRKVLRKVGNVGNGKKLRVHLGFESAYGSEFAFDNKLGEGSMADRIILVGMDEKGYRVGEDHPNAKLTDAQVAQIRLLHEEGFVGYRTLSRLFKTPRSTISDICHYRRRASTLMGVKMVRVKE
jgi:hypothetical protein